MKKQLLATLFIFISPLLFVACVSSILKENPPSFSTDVTIKKPSPQFVKLAQAIYPSWKNQQTGNVISIISDCESSLSLLQLHKLVEDNVSDLKIINEEGTFLNNKPAITKIITGLIDGSPIEILSLSFKRKSCGYVSSLSGKAGTLQTDKNEFDQFNLNLRFE